LAVEQKTAAYLWKSAGLCQARNTRTCKRHFCPGVHCP